MSKVNRGRQDIHGHGNREGKSSPLGQSPLGQNSPQVAKVFTWEDSKRIVAIKL